MGTYYHVAILLFSGSKQLTLCERACIFIKKICLTKVITSFFQCAQINVVKYSTVAHIGKYCLHSSLLNHFFVHIYTRELVSINHETFGSTNSSLWDSPIGMTDIRVIISYFYPLCSIQ